MSVVDGRTFQMVSTIAVDDLLTAITVNPVTNRIYTANYYPNSSASIVDGNTNQTITTLPIDDQGYSIAVNPQTNRVYVPIWMSNTVTVIQD